VNVAVVVVSADAVGAVVIILSEPVVKSIPALAAPVRAGPVQAVPGKVPVKESWKRVVEGLVELPLQAEPSIGSRTRTAHCSECRPNRVIR
jgi:hypothetical protein